MAVAGLMTMPPLAPMPEASREHFAALRELAAAHDLRHLSMGTSQDYRVAVQEGATIVRLGTSLVPLRQRHNHSRELLAPHRNFESEMALRDTWHRTLMYFGLADDEDYEDDLEPYNEPEARGPGRYRDRPNVRRLSSRRRRDEFDDIFADDPEADRRTTSLRPVSTGRGNGRSGGDVRVHLVVPKNFNEVQDVADKFKDAIPVILNLQSTDHDLSKRLIDFSSGLTYALDGGMQRIADKVFLLTPRNVEVSAEERARLAEKGFFNQS